MKKMHVFLVALFLVFGLAACQTTTTTTTTNPTTTSTTTTTTTTTTSTSTSSSTTTTTTTVAPVMVTVSYFLYDGGSMSPTQITQGSMIPIPPNPTRTGYDFVGWYKDAETTISWNFSTDVVNANMTLYAKWEAQIVKYTVSFETNGGSEIPPVQVEEYAKVSRPVDPEKQYLRFAGWYQDETLTEVWDFSLEQVMGNMTLYAKWINESNFNQSFKVLSIGNSFSEDAHRYLWSIAQSYGIAPENIVIANLYIGGSSLANHVSNLTTDAAAYQYQLFTSSSMVATNAVKMSQGIAGEHWDVITIQQVSQDSGMPNSYFNYIERLIEYIALHATNPNVKLYWHSTWAYQQTSTHGGFANYNRDQMTMYQAILDTTVEKVLPISQLLDVIPSGTAIQNARTSYKGDMFTRDGYHLSDPFGRYIAGLMFFKQITGFEVSPAKIAFRPMGLSEQDQLVAFEAVNNAYTKPMEVTDSIYTTEPDPDPIEVQGVLYPFEYVQGFWNENATAISPTTDALHNSFVGVMPISKSMLPVGSEIVLAPGYQYRVIFLEKQGEGFKVVFRTALYQSEYIVIDATFWGNYDYVAFNLTTNPTSAINTRLDEVASKLKLYHPEGTGVGHVDTEVTWSNGKWALGQNAIVTDSKYLSTNPLTPDYYKLDKLIEVSSGYKFATVVLSFENGVYTVESISEYQTTPLSIDPTFAQGKELIAFILSTTDETTDLVPSDAETAISMNPHSVPHIDREISFITGYWELNKPAITTTNPDQTFLNRFAASQPQSKSYYSNVDSIQIASGYQVRVIYLTYDGYGKYSVALRSNNLTGTIVLDETFWGSYEYVAFNISMVVTTDISSSLSELPSKLSYTLDPISFTLGFWNTNATALSTGNTFAANQPIPRQFLPAGTKVQIASGYQVRVVLLNKTDTGYQVTSRSENFVNEFVLTNGLYQDYQYVAFNISTVPTQVNLTDQVGTLGSKLTFVSFVGPVVDHEDAELSFTSGYWNTFGQEVTTGDTPFIKGFGASNVFTKAYFDDMKEIIVASGYQVRVIYLDYSYNVYQVVFRTATNLTGTIVLDEAFWGNYQYVAFNISTNPSTDLSGVLETLPDQLTFVPKTPPLA